MLAAFTLSNRSQLELSSTSGPRRMKKGAEGVATVLTASEVARWLRIPKSTLYKLCQEGEIPATKIGRHWRFQKSFIDDWLKKRMTRGQEST